MDGGDRAGYLQIAGMADSNIITSTMGAYTSTDTGYDWGYFRVISSEAAIALVVAGNIGGSSLISSGQALPLGSVVGGTITSITVSGDSTGHKVQAFRKILI